MASTSGRFSSVFWLMAFRVSRPRISSTLGITPLAITPLTARPASSRSSKMARVVAVARGLGLILRMISVMMPKVPSDPTNRRVRSKPDTLFMARLPVFIRRPSPSTTVRPST